MTAPTVTAWDLLFVVVLLVLIVSLFAVALRPPSGGAR